MGFTVFPGEPRCRVTGALVGLSSKSRRGVIASRATAKTAALDIWSLVNLASGRQPIPELHVEGPGTHPTAATRKGRRGGAVMASPAGIGLSF